MVPKPKGAGPDADIGLNDPRELDGSYTDDPSYVPMYFRDIANILQDIYSHPKYRNLIQTVPSENEKGSPLCLIHPSTALTPTIAASTMNFGQEITGGKSRYVLSFLHSHCHI
jgi:hypothetical protein